MIGIISKSKGFKGDTGLTGPQGPPGEQGIQGVKGDTPSLLLRYDGDTGNLYYDSDGIRADKEYLDSINIATKDFVLEKILELSNKVAPSPASVTLYANRWKQGESETKWYQEVVVANATITKYSKIDLQLSDEQMEIFQEKDLAFVAINDNGFVTVCCIGSIPQNDYVIQATVSEVVVNE